jgi:hypothetical protein
MAAEETTNQESAAPAVEDTFNYGDAGDGVDAVTNDTTTDEADSSAAESAEQSAEPEEESEELDFDGVKIALPKSKAEKLKAERLMHADYTRKTQEVAADRKAVEAEREALANQAKAHQEYIQDLAQVVAIDNSLKQYGQVDWQELNAQDPVKAQALYFQYQQLKEARNAAVGQIQQKETARRQAEEQKALETQQATAKQLQECYATVAKEIKGWGPELAQQLDKTASELGFTNDELRQVKDPRFIKLLHEAHLGRQLLKKQTPPAPKPQPPAKPLPTVGGNAPARKEPERMSMDEWVKHRRKEVHGR